MAEMIRVENLSYNHAGEQALRGVSFSVPQGALHGVIGADGAGKSTLFQILSTLLPPKEGAVHIQGLDAKNNYRKIRSSIGYMPQRFSLYSDLTVLENLRFSAEIMDIPHTEMQQRMEELISFSKLEKAVHRRAGRLSGGMKQKLALCCAIVRKPSLLLLDEPTVGVDPVTRKDFWEMLAVLRSQGTTTFVSTPYMDEAELCDEVILLHEGKILGKGSPQYLCSPLKNTLWEIHGEKMLHVSTGIATKSPLLSLYIMGGSLRALGKEGADADQILDCVQKFCPDALSISQAIPKVEDVLLLALKEMEKLP